MLTCWMIVIFSFYFASYLPLDNSWYCVCVLLFICTFQVNEVVFDGLSLAFIGNQLRQIKFLKREMKKFGFLISSQWCALTRQKRCQRWVMITITMMNNRLALIKRKQRKQQSKLLLEEKKFNSFHSLLDVRLWKSAFTSFYVHN